MNFKFYNTKTTLQQVEKIILNEEKGLYLRFGDGDVNLASGLADMYQPSIKNLSIEMQEAFSINGNNVLKALPIHCKEYGLENGMFPGNHECSKEWADNLLNNVKRFWGQEIQEVYSAVALHHLSVIDESFAIDFLNALKSKSPLALIGNENIPKHIIEKLFGSQCHHIKTPSSNSFSKIDLCEQQVCDLIDDTKYNILVTSMGCSGRVLQKRLYKKYNNIFIFDFGSLLDALCGWNTRAWVELTKFNKDNFLNKL